MCWTLSRSGDVSYLRGRADLKKKKVSHKMAMKKLQIKCPKNSFFGSTQFHLKPRGKVFSRTALSHFIFFIF